MSSGATTSAEQANKDGGESFVAVGGALRGCAEACQLAMW